MENELEFIAFGPIPFVIDREKKELRQFNRPDNLIRFDQLNVNEGYYSAWFDTNANYLSTVRINQVFGTNRLPDIYVPAAVIDSRESLAENIKNDLNILSHKEDWGFHVLDHNTALRLSGMLPHIDLAGTDFTIDWRLKQLRETDEPWNSISLRNMEMSDSGEEYHCFYNTETHELYEPDEDLFDMPENIVVLEIPYEIKLDPIAVAREYGIGETDLLINHPFQMKLTAKVTSLSETGLAKFIEENIKTRDSQTEDNARKAKRGR